MSLISDQPKIQCTCMIYKLTLTYYVFVIINFIGLHVNKNSSNSRTDRQSFNLKSEDKEYYTSI